MRKRIPICFMLILMLIIFLYSCATPIEDNNLNTSEITTDEYLFDENGIINYKSIEYSRDIEPLNRTFKALENTIQDCYWKYYEWGSSYFGPANYNVCGFIMVSLDKVEFIEDQFTFEKISNIENEHLNEGIEAQILKFPNGICPEITGYSDFDWRYSAEFEKWLEAGRWIGDAFYDMNNKIIYVYFGIR